METNEFDRLDPSGMGSPMVIQTDRPQPSEAIARLLTAWQGEVEARAVYEALAARARDPERAASSGA